MLSTRGAHRVSSPSILIRTSPIASRLLPNREKPVGLRTISASLTNVSGSAVRAAPTVWLWAFALGTAAMRLSAPGGPQQGRSPEQGRPAKHIPEALRPLGI